MGFPEMDLVRDHSKLTGLSRFLLYAVARHINNGDGAKYPGQTFVGRDKLMAAIGVKYTKDFYRLQTLLVDSGELIVERDAGPGRSHLRSLALGPQDPPPISGAKAERLRQRKEWEEKNPTGLYLCACGDSGNHYHEKGQEDDCPTYRNRKKKAEPEISDADKETLAGRPTKADMAAVRTQREQAAKQEKKRRNRELAADHMSSEDGGSW